MIDEQYFDLATVIRVDDSGGVEHSDHVRERNSASRTDESYVPIRDSYCESSRDGSAGTRGEV